MMRRRADAARAPASRTAGSAGGTGARARLTILVLAALVGAGCCAGAAAVPWWGRSYLDPLSGPLRAVATGSALLGELVPMALVALAGLGATFAARGLLRRAVGVLVGLGGALLVVRTALAMAQAPVGQLAGQLHRPAAATGPAELALAGPVLALAGGALIALAGALVASGSDHARRMGPAYEAPGRRREEALRSARRRSATAAEPSDPAELWRAIDAGADPTEEPADPADGPAAVGDSAAAARPSDPRDPTSSATLGALPAPPARRPPVPGQMTPPEPDTMGAPDGSDGRDAVRGRRGQTS